MRIAITGGTGFVGAHLVDAAIAAGHEVAALARRKQEPRAGVTWVAGALEDREPLRQLATGADAVIHVAGVLSAPTPAAFDEANVTGTLAMLAAATAGGVHRFVHVSSLAAREPTLSMYGASKARSEELVGTSGLDWVIVRPPAVYGPGDRETLDLFKMASHGVMLMPPPGRLSLLHVDDLARLLLALAADDAPSKLTIEPDDGRPGGWSHRDFAAALGQAVGRKPLVISAPQAALRLAVRADRLMRGDKAKLTADRAAYFAHRDWVADPAGAPPADLWASAIPTGQGLRDTAAWYRSNGWL
ncbi:MAG: NAD-dependent epimerase/dehydratase family protein [Sphingomicrobium sp.]